MTQKRKSNVNYTTSKLLKSAKNNTTIPKYIIEGTLRQAAQESKEQFHSTMRTMLNTIMIATPSKRPRVAYVVLEYCYNNGLSHLLEEDVVIELFGLFAISNLYTKNAFMDTALLDFYIDHYPIDRKKVLFEYLVDNDTIMKMIEVGSTSTVPILSEAKLVVFNTVLFDLMSNDMNACFDIIAKKYKNRVRRVNEFISLMIYVTAKVDSANSSPNKSIQITSRSYSSWYSSNSTHYFDKKCFSGIDTSAVRGFIVNELQQLTPDELQDLINGSTYVNNKNRIVNLLTDAGYKLRYSIEVA